MNSQQAHRQFANLTPLSPFADAAMLSAGDCSTLPFLLGSDVEQRAARATDHEPPRRVLVLGGTGFVGTHLIHRLLLDPRTTEVTTIGRSQGRVSLLRRIISTMVEYGLETAALPLQKLTCIDGDITAGRFGLEPHQYRSLSERIDTVYHSASLTDYSKPYRALRADWVEGMYEAIDFCLERTIKRLTYIGSTIAHLYSRPDDFARPDSWWYSGYAQMKWVNQSILTLLAGRGLPVTVCEAPYVLGSQTVGRDRGLRYTFWRAAAVARQLGMVWDGPGMNFVPVDLLVDTVIENTQRPAPLAIVRPRLPQNYTMASVADEIGCRVVSWEQFHRVVSATPVDAIRRVFPVDLPEIIARTNLDPIFPTESLTEGLRSPADLLEFYLARLDLDASPVERILGRPVAAASA